MAAAAAQQRRPAWFSQRIYDGYRIVDVSWCVCVMCFGGDRERQRFLLPTTHKGKRKLSSQVFLSSRQTVLQKQVWF